MHELMYLKFLPYPAPISTLAYYYNNEILLYFIEQNLFIYCLSASKYTISGGG